MSSERDEPHDFEECLAEGTYWEDKLQRRLQTVLIQDSVDRIAFDDAPDKQRAGIDLEFSLSEIQTIDTKVRDYRWAKYNDIFLETWSVWEEEIPGWFYTTQADAIAYTWKNQAGTNLLETGYLILMSDTLTEWFNGVIDDYPEKDVPNDGWTTKGRPVPVSDFPEEALVPFNARLPKNRLTDQADFDRFGGES